MAHILIIDDSAYMRGKIREILQMEGHEIQEAPDGIKGLQLATAARPDCILLDIIMPGMDGLKILETLRRQGMKIPMIIITADIQESTRRQSFELGATAVINKPPRAEELLATVSAALRQKEGETK